MGVDDPGSGVGGGNVAGGVLVTSVFVGCGFFSVAVGVGFTGGGGVVAAGVGVSVGGGSVSVGVGGSVGVVVVGIGVSVGWGVAVGSVLILTFKPILIEPGSPLAVKMTW